MHCGRFAPSPTGRLHLGNLRTALVAHRFAREHARGRFVIRIEDLDPRTSSKFFAAELLVDLETLGVVSDGPVLFQGERFGIYRSLVRQLSTVGATYECFCSRKEVREAATAPHGNMVTYPGTCRYLTAVQANEKRSTRQPAIRLRVESGLRTKGQVDDVVLVRNDGVPAYNLAVVVDDELQGVTQVVRGNDLAHVTASQTYLQRLLNFRTPEYVHIPLMVGPDGRRLSKRHGDVTLGDCFSLGFSADAVRAALLRSFDLGTNGWQESSSLTQWLESLL